MLDGIDRTDAISDLQVAAEAAIGYDHTSQASKLVFRGAEAQKKGDYDVARMHYDAALILEPQHPLALQNLSGCLLAARQYEAAEIVARRAIISVPNNAYAVGLHAAALLRLNRHKEAIDEFERIVANPESPTSSDPGVWHNLALCLYEAGKIQRAISAIRTSLSLLPDRRTKDDGRIPDLGIFTLATGDISSGLDIYESRWRTLFQSKIWDLGLRQWQGEDLKDKRLLLHHEQGFGDGIMLVRFVPELEKLGAKVTLACPAELKRLFSPMVQCVEWDKELSASEFDYHIPMLSVLRWLKKSPKDISPEPYLKVPSWSRDLPKGLRVGICWESGAHKGILEERRRLIPLKLFFPMTVRKDLRLISLQKGENQYDILNHGAESFITDHMSLTEDWFDTARIISDLDLVISVDSAVAHLAGALGKPTLMLGPYTRCWRWWGETTGLPWYKNFEIFLQSSDKTWNEAMLRVSRRILKWQR